MQQNSEEMEQGLNWSIMVKERSYGCESTTENKENWLLLDNGQVLPDIYGCTTFPNWSRYIVWGLVVMAYMSGFNPPKPDPR